jgi:mono/diheme cytochrome c family protein
MDTTQRILALTMLVASASLLACGGADSRDTDRTSLAASQPHDVMYFDTTALPPKQVAAAGAGGAVSGAEVFTKCAVCHQSSGEGLPGAYPPLARSEWLLNNPEVPIRIVLHGLQGAITVEGKSFNNAMTPFADQLSDAEIAAVITYERSSWGNNAAAITADQVAAVRAATKSQTTPWKPEELQPMIHGK